jgi:protein-disulfide isomerase
VSTATTHRRSRRPSPSPAPAARSPIPLLTIAALVVGALVVGVLALTSGVLDRAGGRDLVQPDITRPADLVDGRTVGAPDAPITIQMWEDFQCPACGMFSRSMEPRLLEAYVVPGQVRLMYRDMAFLGQESIDAAVAARAAERLLGGDGFWRFHDLLFHNQDGENEGAFDRGVLADMAVSLGIDRDAFLAQLDDPDLVAAVTAETRDGQQAGVTSTPTLDIDGQMAAGVPTWDALSAYLDGLLAADGSAR